MAIGELGIGSCEFEISGIPFLVTIRDFVSSRSKKPELTLIEFMSNHVSSTTGAHCPPGFVEFWLSKENSLTVFDGLDEVIGSADRQQTRDIVRSLIKEHSESEFIITSRVVGYEEAPLDRDYFLHLLILELRSPQVEMFVRRWYSEREPNPSDRVAAINGLLEALKDKHVAELAQNPLLLTIMALVHRGESDLPKQRALLYDKCAEAFMVSRNRAKDLLSYDEYEIRECHEFLGYWMHGRAEKREDATVPLVELRESLLENMLGRHPDLGIRAEQKVDEFIEAARKRVGLLVERGGSLWAFGHRSFQEYFAAKYISQNTFGLAEVWSEVEGKIDKPHWVEPLKLLSGIYGFTNRKGLADFVTRILDEHKRVKDPASRRLILAGEIAGEVELDYLLVQQIATETIELLLETKDGAVFSNCKRVLNHFYNDDPDDERTRLWGYIVKRIKERTRAFHVNPAFYSGTAFHGFCSGRQFGDTKIDAVLAMI